MRRLHFRKISTFSIVSLLLFALISFVGVACGKAHIKGNVVENRLGDFPFGDLLGGAKSITRNGCRYALVVQKGDRQLVIVDGKPGPEYDRIWVGPVFLKDGTVQYIARRGDDESDSFFRILSFSSLRKKGRGVRGMLPETSL